MRPSYLVRFQTIDVIDFTPNHRKYFRQMKLQIQLFGFDIYKRISKKLKKKCLTSDIPFLIIILIVTRPLHKWRPPFFQNFIPHRPRPRFCYNFNMACLTFQSFRLMMIIWKWCRFRIVNENSVHTYSITGLFLHNSYWQYAQNCRTLHCVASVRIHLCSGRFTMAICLWRGCVLQMM